MPASLNPTFQSHMVCLNSNVWPFVAQHIQRPFSIDPGCELCHQRRSHLGVMENAFGHLPPLPIKHPQDFVLTRHQRGRLMIYTQRLRCCEHTIWGMVYTTHLWIFMVILGMVYCWVDPKNGFGSARIAMVLYKQLYRLDKSHSSPWRNCLRVSSTQLSQQKVQ